jgi:hypothetical protein
VSGAPRFCAQATWLRVTSPVPSGRTARVAGSWNPVARKHEALPEDRPRRHFVRPVAASSATTKAWSNPSQLMMRRPSLTTGEPPDACCVSYRRRVFHRISPASESAAVPSHGARLLSHSSSALRCRAPE